MSASPWQRVKRDRPCAICGRGDWCLYIGPRENPQAFICARVESKKRCGDAGWLHKTTNERWEYAPPPKQELQLPDFTKMNQRFQNEITDADISVLSLSLGLTEESLRRMDVGWCGWGYTFPMRDMHGTPRGIRVRKRDGSKLAITASKDGLFIPSNLNPSQGFYVCEGPTDTAAMLDLGMQAVGRPSCQGATMTLVEYVKKYQPMFVGIVADSDEPGTNGAVRLKTILAPHSWCYVFCPPAKDVRAFLNDGGKREELEKAATLADRRARALYEVRL